MDSSKPTLEQKRAAHAWGFVQEAKNLQDKGKKFGGEAKKLPMRIITAGLGQAMCFLKAKGETPELEKALSQWILKERKIGDNRYGEDLLEAIRKSNAEFLHQATDEALAYLQWLRRFADAEGLTKDAMDQS